MDKLEEQVSEEGPKQRRLFLQLVETIERQRDGEQEREEQASREIRPFDLCVPYHLS